MVAIGFGSSVSSIFGQARGGAGLWLRALGPCLLPLAQRRAGRRHLKLQRPGPALIGRHTVAGAALHVFLRRSARALVGKHSSIQVERAPSPPALPLRVFAGSSPVRPLRCDPDRRRFSPPTAAIGLPPASGPGTDPVRRGDLKRINLQRKLCLASDTSSFSSQSGTLWHP